MTAKTIFEDRRMVTIWGTPDNARMVDVTLLFTATHGDVKFGDTKEGGLLSLRVAGTMKEKQNDGSRGGTIINANGEKDEKDAWGKAAPWCDYSGPVGEIIAGLTIMDHPENPFYPTRYHVRNYGLFTANSFGLSYFLRDRSIDGSQILKDGQSWLHQYRVYIHEGDVNEGKVTAAYTNFASEPTVILR